MNGIKGKGGMTLPGRTWVCAFLSAFVGAAFTTQGQPFLNLDFESTGSPNIAPDSIWLSWSLAAPAWTHPQGGDSLFVYHHTPPSTSIAQFYFLVDETSTQWSPLEGNRSLALVSGHYDRNNENSPWVQAYIEQQAMVPEDAVSFRLLGTGSVCLSLDSQELPLSNLGGGSFGADISQFAGQVVTLRVASQSTTIQDPVIVDKMEFSSQPIPEPGSLSILGVGLVALFIRARIARRQS